MLISIKIARSEHKNVSTINREEINRTVNTTSASLGMNSIMKYSTPPLINYSPRSAGNAWRLIINNFLFRQQIPLNETEMDISQNSPENIVLNDDMVVDPDNDSGADYSFWLDLFIAFVCKLIE